MNERLVDLYELVLHCRDEQARQYISEAVACYKMGAFRSCIVATWIAIVFDFIYKLRELELTGDRNAKSKLEEFEKIRKNNDVTGSLNFEKRILELAKDEFQLTTPLEPEYSNRLLASITRWHQLSLIPLSRVVIHHKVGIKRLVYHRLTIKYTYKTTIMTAIYGYGQNYSTAATG